VKKLKVLIYGINYSPELTGIGKYSGEMGAWLAKSSIKTSVITAPPYYPNWKVADGYSALSYKKEIIDDITNGDRPRLNAMDSGLQDHRNDEL